jgi:CDP-diacylglycerol---glycerol-3-phosphate 3-phosphatidyltransferase
VNIPNTLTMLRVGLVPVLAVALAKENYEAALAVFLLGMTTDILDGHIARTRGPITDFGKLMDPIADKLFVGTAFVCLALLDRMEMGVVAVILSREAAVSGLRFVAKRQGTVISADGLGKAKTGLQSLTIAVLILASEPGLEAVQLLTMVTAFVTILSGMSYFMAYALAPDRARPTRIRPISSPG